LKRRGKRRGAQLVRFTVARTMEWERDRAGGYIGWLLSEPGVVGAGVTLAELRRNLVTAWRRHHGALVKPTGRPPTLAQDRRSRGSARSR